MLMIAFCHNCSELSSTRNCSSELLGSAAREANPCQTSADGADLCSLSDSSGTRCLSPFFFLIRKKKGRKRKTKKKAIINNLLGIFSLSDLLCKMMTLPEVFNTINKLKPLCFQNVTAVCEQLSLSSCLLLLAEEAETPSPWTFKDATQIYF